MMAVVLGLIARRRVAWLALVALVGCRRGAPGLVVAPAKAEIDQFPRFGQRREGIDGGANDRRLIGPIVRLARSVAQGIVDEGGARRVCGADDVIGARHAEGRQTGRFQVSGNQTNGLVADGSQRDQQGDIDRLLAEGVFERRRQFVAHAALRINSAHA